MLIHFRFIKFITLQLKNDSPVKRHCKFSRSIYYTFSRPLLKKLLSCILRCNIRLFFSAAVSVTEIYQTYNCFKGTAILDVNYGSRNPFGMFILFRHRHLRDGLLQLSNWNYITTRRRSSLGLSILLCSISGKVFDLSLIHKSLVNNWQSSWNTQMNTFFLKLFVYDFCLFLAHLTI